MDKKTIRAELRDIKYFYAKKKIFDDSNEKIGEISIVKTVRKYNSAICKASPRLYDIYVNLYLNGLTGKEYAFESGYTVETISRFHSQLVNFFQEAFLLEEM